MCDRRSIIKLCMENMYKFSCPEFRLLCPSKARLCYAQQYVLYTPEFMTTFQIIITYR